jgi:ADP-ribose pyrophosphatase YjhB (NUDIX family)
LEAQASTFDEFSKWARFGVDQDGIKYIPVGGVCVMCYLISKKDSKLLVGEIDGEKHGDLWKDKWGIYIHRESIWKEKWFVPSGFLHFGEDPDACAERLLKELLGGKAKALRPTKVITFTQNSKYYPGYHHWHICFIYEVDGIELGKRPVYLSKLEYVETSKLSAGNVGMAGGKVLQKLGIVS